MGNFNSNRSDRSRPNTSRGTEGPQMHQATCSKCGKSCMVPFKPTGNRPIFCSDCFKTESGQLARRTDDRSTRPPGDRQMYEATCDTCGTKCQIPFQPRSGKPVYCSHCFEQREKEGKGFRERPQSSPSTDQFAALNAKLDKILSLLSTQDPTSPSLKKVAKEKDIPTLLSPQEAETEIESLLKETTEEATKPVKKTAKKAALKKTATKKKAAK